MRGNSSDHNKWGNIFCHNSPCSYDRTSTNFYTW
uniref:Uncharacterized protein n=1 Tax=mine drainage metagenome TaxID=410659 RepID=E6QLI7_9ZZZZ